MIGQVVIESGKTESKKMRKIIAKDMRKAAWVALYSTSTDRVLVAKRSSKVNNASQWNLFGGGVEEKDPVDSAARELHEEAGFAVPRKELTYLGKVADLDIESVHYFYVLYVEDEEKPKLNKESSKAKWISLNKLRKISDKHSSLRNFLKVIKKPKAERALLQ